MSSRVELEKALEQRCVKRVEDLGGLALKLKIDGVRGFPDRTILLPGQRIWFAEFKRLKTGTISAQQLKWADVLRSLGFDTLFIDTYEQFHDRLMRR